MNQLNPIVVGILRTEIIQCIKELLETKYLYQSVKIDISDVEKMIEHVNESIEVKQYMKRITASSGLLGHPGTARASLRASPVSQFVQDLQQKMKNTSDTILEAYWSFSTDAFDQLLAGGGLSHKEKEEEPSHFVLPTISVPCKKCDGTIQPHNSGFRWQPQEFQAVSFKINKDGKEVPFQTFVFPYHCQKCKEEPLVFLVHREGTKLTLTGRNHFETVQVPKAIPGEEKEYFSDAVVAYRTGNILAGLFLLRTTIEQYMRRILNVTGKKRGEDLADEYAKLLHDEFPQSLTSMKVIYEELSIPIHSADKDTAQFEKSKKDIEQHFEQLKLLPLKKRKGKK